MTFWLIIAVLALIVSVILLLALWRGGRHARPAAEFDLKVYRDQLAEVDRDEARGVLSGEDGERARAEISRRILAADSAAQQATSARASSPALRAALTGIIAATLIGGSLYLYRDLGAPGYGDLALSHRIEMAEKTRASRPSQQKAEDSLPPFVINPNVDQNYRDLVTKLREAVAKRPDDLQGARLLARHEMALGDSKAAYGAQENILRLLGADATADDFATYADMLVLAAGGYVSPQAEAALSAALQKDPDNGAARYYTGLMMAQIGRPDKAFRAWAGLLQSSAPDDAWVGPIRGQIEEMAFRAGVNYELPEEMVEATEPSGPSAEDVENAQSMSEEERQDMIRGMVERLSDRLATEGGPAQDWARLLNALGVLGEADQAALIWQNAKTVFADKPDALETVRRAAQQIGVVQ